jgi:general secretion pathway protein D
VAVLNGQTIVIGGLIEDQIQDTIRKVPILGNIPLAGALFRRTIKSTSKTELLIFLTPYVAEDALALNPISDNERNRSTMQNDASMNKLYQIHMEGIAGLKDPNEKSDATKK